MAGKGRQPALPAMARGWRCGAGTKGSRQYPTGGGKSQRCMCVCMRAHIYAWSLHALIQSVYGQQVASALTDFSFWIHLSLSSTVGTQISSSFSLLSYFPILMNILPPSNPPPKHKHQNWNATFVLGVFFVVVWHLFFHACFQSSILYSCLSWTELQGAVSYPSVCMRGTGTIFHRALRTRIIPLTD